GDDKINGGPGIDRMKGGPGYDTCVFSSRKELDMSSSCEKKARSFARSFNPVLGDGRAHHLPSRQT
ncbi:MAG TPA: hypothetical protein VE174_07700, partial [Actinomycetota bacterium]|nr:hypothetical protein [Actinomycetota bacterium]